MTMSTKITVAAPASKVWSVLFDDYMALDTWMASIDKTRPLDNAQGNPLVRIADLGAGAPGAWLEETAEDVDPSNRSMTIVTKIEGMPDGSPINGFTSKIGVNEISPDETEVTWDATSDIQDFAMPNSEQINTGLTA